MELEFVPTHSLLDEVRHGPKKKKKKKKKEKKKEKETWNTSLGNSSSICTKLEFPKLEFLVKNLGTQVSETRVPLFFLLKKKI